MTVLKPKPGFDWRLVTWGRPDSPPSALCSYCHAALGEDEVPLILWNDDGWAARFCTRCMETWFGFSCVDDGGEYGHG